MEVARGAVFFPDFILASRGTRRFSILIAQLFKTDAKDSIDARDADIDAGRWFVSVRLVLVARGVLRLPETRPISCDPPEGTLGILGMLEMFQGGY